MSNKKTLGKKIREVAKGYGYTLESVEAIIGKKKIPVNIIYTYINGKESISKVIPEDIGEIYITDEESKGIEKVIESLKNGEPLPEVNKEGFDVKYFRVVLRKQEYGFNLVCENGSWERNYATRGIVDEDKPEDKKVINAIDRVLN